MLIIYVKSSGVVVDNQGINSLYPNGIADYTNIIQSVMDRLGGVESDYGIFRLHDIEDAELVKKTYTYEYTIQNGKIIFGGLKPVPEPEPQPPSEIEQLRLEMARGNAELFETMLTMLGGV